MSHTACSSFELGTWYIYIMYPRRYLTCRAGPHGFLYEQAYQILHCCCWLLPRSEEGASRPGSTGMSCQARYRPRVLLLLCCCCCYIHWNGFLHEHANTLMLVLTATTIRRRSLPPCLRCHELPGKVFPVGTYTTAC